MHISRVCVKNTRHITAAAAQPCTSELAKSNMYAGIHTSCTTIALITFERDAPRVLDKMPSQKCANRKPPPALPGLFNNPRLPPPSPPHCSPRNNFTTIAPSFIFTPCPLLPLLFAAGPLIFPLRLGAKWKRLLLCLNTPRGFLMQI